MLQVPVITDVSAPGVISTSLSTWRQPAKTGNDFIVKQSEATGS